tara:strand:- start:73 stop:525 length:453 start_codon:yes stop_codon:yes gene_type:complete
VFPEGRIEETVESQKMWLMTKPIRIFLLFITVFLRSHADDLTPPPPPGIWMCDYGEDEDFINGRNEASLTIVNGNRHLLLSGIVEEDEWIKAIHDSGISTSLSDYRVKKDHRFSSGFNQRMIEEVRKMEIYHSISQMLRSDEAVCEQYRN